MYVTRKINSKQNKAHQTGEKWQKQIIHRDKLLRHISGHKFMTNYKETEYFYRPYWA